MRACAPRKLDPGETHGDSATLSTRSRGSDDLLSMARRRFGLFVSNLSSGPPRGAGPGPDSGRPNARCSTRRGRSCGQQRTSTASLLSSPFLLRSEAHYARGRGTSRPANTSASVLPSPRSGAPCATTSESGGPHNGSGAGRSSRQIATRARADRPSDSLSGRDSSYRNSRGAKSTR
jgi:hypothetical protein